ncbi:MAG: hypothetical protein V8S96_02575 [Lachnospiraceae bacterium]
MSTAFLDSFQLVIALYLFYIAFKGDGQMYRFGNLSEDQQAQVKSRFGSCIPSAVSLLFPSLESAP